MNSDDVDGVMNDLLLEYAELVESGNKLERSDWDEQFKPMIEAWGETVLERFDGNIALAKKAIAAVHTVFESLEDAGLTAEQGVRRSPWNAAWDPYPQGR